MTEEEGMEDVTTTEQDPPTSPTGGGIQIRGVQVYEREQLPYAGCFLSGIILLVALVSKRDLLKEHKYYKYGIAIAVVAMVFALVGWILSRAGNVVFLQYNNYFLFVWNFVGACFMTFGGPFKGTGNGYFASWGIALFSIMALGVNAEQIKRGAKNMGPLMGVFATSVITFVAIVSEGFDNPYKGELIYSIVVAALSIILCIYLIMSEPTMLAMPVLALFAVLWIVAASLLTFRGPFFLTGNGYFASWGAAFASVFATFAALSGGGGGAGQQQEETAEDTI